MLPPLASPTENVNARWNIQRRKLPVNLYGAEYCGWSDRGLAKTAWWGASQFVLLTKCC